MQNNQEVFTLILTSYQKILQKLESFENKFSINEVNDKIDQLSSQLSNLEQKINESNENKFNDLNLPISEFSYLGFSNKNIEFIPEDEKLNKNKKVNKTNKKVNNNKINNKVNDNKIKKVNNNKIKKVNNNKIKKVNNNKIKKVNNNENINDINSLNMRLKTTIQNNSNSLLAEDFNIFSNSIEEFKKTNVKKPKNIFKETQFISMSQQPQKTVNFYSLSQNPLLQQKRIINQQDRSLNSYNLNSFKNINTKFINHYDEEKSTSKDVTRF
ncbi:hypothetical protein HERIO_1554 [Hepatospora eriocheir]|uniref:Uncharacterized protein n=1 Tax=Hepatospora eriocheir TaxID=1081669 RepID=A0A1X0Q9S6_9MICR|nr:hypothetical protein HERIO_1554 [Hepatospora eriocheir]